MPEERASARAIAVVLARFFIWCPSLLAGLFLPSGKETEALL
jgi:hypothetical protein